LPVAKFSPDIKNKNNVRTLRKNFYCCKIFDNTKPARMPFFRAKDKRVGFVGILADFA